MNEYIVYSQKFQDDDKKIIKQKNCIHSDKICFKFELSALPSLLPSLLPGLVHVKKLCPTLTNMDTAGSVSCCSIWCHLSHLNFPSKFYECLAIRSRGVHQSPAVRKSAYSVREDNVGLFVVLGSCVM